MRADDQNDRQNARRGVTARAAALIRSIREASLHTIAWTAATALSGAAASAAKLWAGIASHSAFLTAGAIYGAALSVARATVLRQFARQKSIADEKRKTLRAVLRVSKKRRVSARFGRIVFFGLRLRAVFGRRLSRAAVCRMAVCADGGGKTRVCRFRLGADAKKEEAAHPDAEAFVRGGRRRFRFRGGGRADNAALRCGLRRFFRGGNVRVRRADAGKNALRGVS